MAHIHDVIDTDIHYKIDGITRAITNLDETKRTLVQNDHKSERFTFEIPRYIDGHDLSTCNSVQIHYVNVDKAGKERSADIYFVEDVGVKSDDENVVIFTWLIKRNATKYAGTIDFNILFACIDEDGTIDYAWNTAIFKSIFVADGINNTEAVEEEYADALEQWHREIDKAVEGAENVNISAEQTATGATITVTDKEGMQTSVHIDTLTAIETWEGVKNAVRLGLGATLFPIGYEFTTEDSVTGAVITWVVRGHDDHIAANRRLTHTMTLETKYVYSLASGTCRSFVFDATEALYYAARGLRAGTYHFTLLADYDVAYGGGKTLSFTLTKPVPEGGVIMFPWANQERSTDTKISTYASNAATEAIESVAVRESLDGIGLGVADGTETRLNHTHRIRYGSNNYAQSAIRQWLNSDAAVGGVWAPTNVFDRPPSWNASYSGFMRGLPADFLAVVQPAAIPCRTNSIFEVKSLDGTKFDINQVYTLKDKFFLLSRPEIYGTWDNETYKDGTLLKFYKYLTDAECTKYDAAGLARICWLRSPHPGHAYSERSVRAAGALNYNRARYEYGVAPACIIA